MLSTHQSKSTPGLGGAFLPEGQRDPAHSDLIIARWLGCLTAGVGAIILTGWIAGLPLFKSLLPQQVEAKANTAVCFILAGVALAVKSRRDRSHGHPKVLAANLGAALVAFTGLVTLSEYAFGWNLGIDELLFRDSVGAAYTVHAGRMALPTALNFLLLGLAALVLEAGRNRIVVAWLAIPSAGLAGLALLGELYGLPFLESLGPFTPIAAPTCIAFLILSSGVLLAGSDSLIARWRRSGRTIGFVLALLLLLVMGGAVLRNAQALVRNSRQVSHTHEVIGKLTATLSAMQDVETGTRGYLLTGDARFLEPYQPAPAEVGRLLQELRSLTAEIPVQQRRLDRLGTLITQKISSAKQQIAMREQGEDTGSQIAIASGEGRRLMDAIRQIVAEMHQEEKRLLGERQARTEASTLRTLLSLGAGLAVSVGLLLTVFNLLRREIARRAQTEVALRRSEESLAVTLHSIGDAVLSTDTEGRVTLMNHVAEQLTGWPLAEARGRPIAEVFRILNEETRQPATIPVDHVLATGEIHGLANHTVLIARDGTERAIADSAAPIHDKDRRILGVVLVFRDTTESRRAEEKLRKSAAEIHDLYNRAPCGYHSLDAEGVIVAINETELDWIGQTREEVVGRQNIASLLTEESRAVFRKNFPRFKAQGALNSLELQLVRKDGSSFPVLLNATAIRDAQGNYLSSRSTLFDITQRKRAEEELDRFFTLSLDFLCISSADGYFKRVSPIVTDILGWSPEEFLTRPFIDLVHPDDRVATLREVERQVVDGEKVLQFENRYRHKDGSWRVLSWRSVPHGGLMYATARDVTEIKRNEEQIRQLNSDLQRHASKMENTNRELESFSYSVSHDLRAPLRHVQGYVEMLTREAQAQLSDKGRRYLQTIADAAREMGELIDDLLAFSRMGRTEMQEAVVDLAALVEDTRRGLELATRSRDIRWKVGDLPLVRGDTAMLKQVLVNLLGNAVKYTRPRNPAEIEIGCAGVEEGRVIFFVRDNGAGFDMKYADKLFGVFQRLHRADEFEGTGIGLASVRRIITRHGGRTWAEGRVNAGATLFFTLAPAAASESTTPARS